MSPAATVLASPRRPGLVPVALPTTLVAPPAGGSGSAHSTGAPAGELRPVTMLFGDVRGFTGLAQILPAEQLVAAINRVWGALSEPLVQYGGVIDKYLGDGIMARFGAPVAHEDDARRAVLAAMAMQEALRRSNKRLRAEMGVELEMRIGINTGIVLAGTVGSSYLSSYTVMGDAVNVAARLEKSAPIGGIVIGEATRAHLGGAFRLRLRSSQRIRGREGTHRSYVVLGLSTGTRRGSRAHVACVGRQVELRELAALLARARAGVRTVVAVTGATGVGKTRFIEALRTGHAGHHFVWSTVACPPHGQALPYGSLSALLRSIQVRLARRHGQTSLRRLLRDYCGATGIDTELVAGVVEDLLVDMSVNNARTQALPAQLRKGLLARATKALLEAMTASGRPYVVALDDCQWLDSASLAIIAEAINDLPRARVAWILVHRDDHQPDWPWRTDAEIVLHPLSASAAKDIVRMHLGAEVAEPTADFLVERAAGNPLVLVELCGAVAESDDPIERTLATNEPAGSLHEPVYLTELIRSLVLSRIDSLDGRARHALQVCSVLGSVFPVSLVRAVLGPGDWFTVLDRLEAAGLLVRETRARGDGGSTVQVWRFDHALVQEAVYATLLSATRSVLHRQAGLALEPMSDAGIADRLASLAFHFSRSDDREKAVCYLRAAGDRARELYLNEQAVRYYDDALVRLSHEGVDRALRARVLAAKSAALVFLADDERALDCLLGALELEDDAAERADLWRRVAEVQRLRGDFGPARASLVQARECLGSDCDSVALARVHIARAMVEVDTGDAILAGASGQAALKALAGSGSPKETAAAHWVLGVSAASRGQLDEAVVALNRALDIARGAHDALTAATAAAELGNLAAGRHDDVAAQGMYAESLSLYERIGAKRGVARLCHSLGTLAWRRDDWDAARDYWERACRLDEEIGDKRGLLAEVKSLGTGFAEQGSKDEALPYLTRARDLANELQDQESLNQLEEYLAAPAPAAGNEPSRTAHRTSA